MAKLERQVHGSFDGILNSLHQAVLQGSMSASYEDGSDFAQGDFRCAVRVYERYSWSGGNRVSLTLTLAGSQGTFFKLNTFGEEAFLDTIAPVIENL